MAGAPSPVVAAFLGLKNGRGAFLELVDAGRQVADDVLVEVHLALHFLDRVGGRVDVHENVMPLAVLLDPVGHGAQAPGLLLGHRTAEVFDDFFESVGQAVDLGRRNVLARDEHALVKSHVLISLRIVSTRQRLRA